MSDQNENDEMGRLLTDELRRRTDAAHWQEGAPLQLHEVRGKATSIRRRRRVASGLGVAAAIAVIVPTAMLATRNADSDGPLPATDSPTARTTQAAPTPTATPVAGPKPHALDVSDLPTGAPPAISVIEGSGDSSVASTDEAEVHRSADGVVVEAGGRTFGPYPSSSGLARNAAGTAVAWVTDDGTVMAWQDGHTEPNTLGSSGLQGAQVAAVTGDGCVNGTLAGDCRVFVRGSDQSGQPRSLAFSRGGTDAVDPGEQIRGVQDADELGRVLGITSYEADGSCSAVLAPPSTSPLLASCGYTFDAFSPDGTYVLASEAYHDGASSGTIAVFEAAGDRLAYRTRTGPHMAGYHQAVWEDERHVLFTAVQDGQWSVVRMDAVTGAMEYAIAPRAGDPYQSPFVLESR